MLSNTLLTSSDGLHLASCYVRSFLLLVAMRFVTSRSVAVPLSFNVVLIHASEHGWVYDFVRCEMFMLTQNLFLILWLLVVACTTFSWIREGGGQIGQTLKEAHVINKNYCNISFKDKVGQREASFNDIKQVYRGATDVRLRCGGCSLNRCSKMVRQCLTAVITINVLPDSTQA